MAQRDRPKTTASSDESAVEEATIILAEPLADDSAVPPTTDAPAPPPPLPVAPQRSVFLPAVGGGALAAVIGFGLSHFNILGLALAPADTSALDARMVAVEEGLTRTRTELAELAAKPPASDPALADRLSALESAVAEPVSDPRLDDIIGRMTALETQLAEAATAGTGPSGAALAALQAEVRALKSAPPVATEDLSAQVAETHAALAEAKALAADIRAIAASAAITAALGQLRGALDTGQPYTAALGMLQGAEIPPALSDHAATGLPTLARLQEAFPDAARDALDAALRANPGESWTDRVGTFLRSQTGARSVTPREGADPDAVLSRAEAALAIADLDTALKETATLPDEAKAAMAEWNGLAEQRRAAAAAIDALSAKSGG
jgi:hypothetical protein